MVESRENGNLDGVAVLTPDFIDQREHLDVEPRLQHPDDGESDKHDEGGQRRRSKEVRPAGHADAGYHKYRRGIGQSADAIAVLQNETSSLKPDVLHDARRNPP